MRGADHHPASADDWKRRERCRARRGFGRRCGFSDRLGENRQRAIAAHYRPIVSCHLQRTDAAVTESMTFATHWSPTSAGSDHATADRSRSSPVMFADATVQSS